MSPLHEAAERELSSRLERTPQLPIVKVENKSAAPNKEQFKTLLLNVYGNFVRAWREGLDRDHNGLLDWQEFMRACKDVGFAGSLKQLWVELEPDENGVVTLAQIDRTTANLLEEITACALRRYGTWDLAWRAVFDPRGEDRVNINTFLKGCAALGFTGDARYLFDLLDMDRAKFLSFEPTKWMANPEAPEESKQLNRSAKNASMMKDCFVKTTRCQMRRMDFIFRDRRMLKQRVAARARTEIVPLGSRSPGRAASPRAQNDSSWPNTMFRSASSPSATAPGDLNLSQSRELSQGLPSVTKARPPTKQPGLPDWVLVSEGRLPMPELPSKMDLRFPLAPQVPGKGGWPGSKVKLIDPVWGGSKDIGEQLSPMVRATISPQCLSRWKSAAKAEH